MNNDIKFGSYNIATGECLEGYMDKGAMKYRRYPWYKRLYWAIFPSKIKLIESLPESAPEYMGIIDVSNTRDIGGLFSTHVHTFTYECALYKEIKNGKRYYYFDLNGRRRYIYPNAFEDSKSVVILN